MFQPTGAVCPHLPLQGESGRRFGPEATKQATSSIVWYGAGLSERTQTWQSFACSQTPNPCGQRLQTFRTVLWLFRVYKLDSGFSRTTRRLRHHLSIYVSYNRVSFLKQYKHFDPRLDDVNNAVEFRFKMYGFVIQVCNKDEFVWFVWYGSLKFDFTVLNRLVTRQWD